VFVSELGTVLVHAVRGRRELVVILAQRSAWGDAGRFRDCSLPYNTTVQKNTPSALPMFERLYTDSVADFQRTVAVTE